MFSQVHQDARTANAAAVTTAAGPGQAPITGSAIGCVPVYTHTDCKAAEDLWDLPRKLGHAHHKVHSSAAAQGDGDTLKVREAVLKWLK